MLEPRRHHAVLFAAAIVAAATVLAAGAPVQARTDSPAVAAITLAPMRAISIPFGITSASLTSGTILVRGHDGSPPVIVDSVDTLDSGCPPDGHTVDIRIQVRDRSMPATLAKGEGTTSCGDATWQVTAAIQTPGAFVAGSEVWVCAHALVRSDPDTKPGKKGHVVGYRQWCKTLTLE